ncbi:protein of unknown function [Burkholderia multivorans]
MVADATRADTQPPLTQTRRLAQTAQHFELNFLLETSESVCWGYGDQSIPGTLPPCRSHDRQARSAGLQQGEETVVKTRPNVSSHVRRTDGLCHTAMTFGTAPIHSPGRGDSAKSRAPIRPTKAFGRPARFGMEPATAGGGLIELLQTQEASVQGEVKRGIRAGRTRAPDRSSLRRLFLEQNTSRHPVTRV